MSGGIPDIAGIGILPLRHEDARVDIGLRHVVNAVALQKIDPLDPNLITEVPGSVGDLLCASFWSFDRSKRNCAGWSFAWPAMVTKPELKSGNGTGGTRLRTDEEPQKLRPIRDATLQADERFEEHGHAFPAWAGRLPKGWTGVSIAATNEDRQEGTFHPAFLGLVTSEAGGGDPDLSSVVLDLDDQNRVDPARRAHLNSVWRVVKSPTTKIPIGTQNGIAWQLGIGRGDRAGAGLVAGPRSHGGAPLACMAANAGGPVVVPGAGDQHQIGSDGDGNPISAAHLTTRTIFKSPQDARKDSPVAFEEAPFPAKLEPGQFLTAAHLRWNAAAGHRWGSPEQQGTGLWQFFAETLMYVPEPPEPPPPTSPPPPPTSPPPPTTHRPPKKGGRREPPPTSPPPPPTSGPTDPPQPPPTTGGGRVDPPTDGDDGPPFEEPAKPTGRLDPPRPPDDNPPQNPKPWREPGTPSGSIDGPTGLQKPPPSDGPAGGQYEPGRARKGDVDPNADPNRPLLPPEGGGDGLIHDPTHELEGAPTEGPFGPNPWEPPPGDDNRKRRQRDRVYVEASRRELVDRLVAAVLLELSVSSIAIRPGSFSCGGIDLSGSMRPTEAEVREHDKTSPVMARIEGAWAKPGGDCNGGLPSYTARPGAARYVGGTASGVVGYFPAEVGMRDWASNFAPPGIDVSTVHHTALKGKVFFGSGYPDPTGGLCKSGYTWGANATTGAMEFHERDSSGSVASTSTMPRRTGSIVQAPSALTSNTVIKGDANGDATNSTITDDAATIVLGSPTTQIGNGTAGTIRTTDGNTKRDLTIRASNAASGNNNGGLLTAQGGSGVGSGIGGSVAFAGGAAGATGSSGGNVIIRAGDAGVTSGDGGTTLVRGGSNGNGSGVAGSTTIQGGDGTGGTTAGGGLTLRPGTSVSGTKGDLSLCDGGSVVKLKIQGADSVVTPLGTWDVSVGPGVFKLNRGAIASKPSLSPGEIYMSTDTNELVIGHA